MTVEVGQKLIEAEVVETNNISSTEVYSGLNMDIVEKKIFVFTKKSSFSSKMDSALCLITYIEHCLEEHFLK